jgi:hypothetical protein
MCESGKYDNAMSRGERLFMSAQTRAVHATLRWDSIAALGGPVVPDV